MSIESVQTIVGRAVTEPDYRELLFNDPEKALEGYELSDEEASALKGIEREKFDAVAGELEERVSKAGGMFLMGEPGVRESLGRIFGDALTLDYVR